jgi:CubicO group peptidase (beta-lactamase class C family)
MHLEAQTSTDIPRTPAGKRLEESLDLINTGDMEKIRDYISTQFTQGFLKLFGKERLFKVYYGFFEKFQGLEFHKTIKSSPHKFVAVHRCRLTGSGYQFGLAVLPKPPHKIRGMTILPLAHPDEPESLEPLNQEEKIKMLEAFIDRLGEAGVFSGAILLSKGGNALMKKAYGMASRRFAIPNRIDTKFNLASLNKMFTAIAAAQLCEQGKLSYDDPIGQYLDINWIPKKIGNKVLIKHLLSHTSGISIGGKDDNLTYLEESFKRQFREIEDYKAFSAKAKLKFKPGKEFSYSNMGMHLMGPIIEKISGETYEQYLQRHIFSPAEMYDTGFDELDRPEPGVALGYVKEYKDGKFIWKNNVLACQIKGTPAGGAYSTVEDLLRFENALRNNSLISEKSKNILFTAKKELNASTYGYGFRVRTFGDKLQVGHTGGYIGINNLFSMYLNKGYTVIILSNVDLVSGSPCSDIEFFILSLFF